MQWRVKPALPAAKLITAVAVLALAAGFAGDDPGRWAAAGITAAVLVLWAVRDLMVRVRLAADGEGITVVTGVARRRHVPWAKIERVRVDRTHRRMLRGVLLEIDAGDAIYMLGANELGADPDDVAARLEDLRAVS
ncbi:PH domain-containing protein [Actinoplanes flavus]|uniref:PH domain-containing protein n=1 Tax=Actinoplanes flavus TaxID=2820290 RepID=A0ABS3UL51_9ACTN|nr:PH domain-containing protein [Actinoplanes flavus]MBO3739461.1 PH domain-containing protein [Actinoplanes flavus]